MFSLASSMKSSCFGLIKSDIRPLSIFTKSSSVLQSIKLNNQSNSIMNGRGSSLPFAMKVMQRRFKSRGNTYQPSTLKRKRTFGFLARLRSKNGRKILSRRAAKARWYLTH